MTIYRTTRQADRDIVEIYLRGYREFGQRQAELYHQGLDRDLRLIATNPRIARERAQFKPPVRLYPYRAHLIIYLVDSAGVLMVRVLHNRQEWERHL